LKNTFPSFWVIVHVLSYPDLIFWYLMPEADRQLVFRKQPMQSDILSHHRSWLDLHDKRQGFLPTTIGIISLRITSFFCLTLLRFYGSITPLYPSPTPKMKTLRTIKMHRKIFQRTDSKKEVSTPPTQQ